MGFSPFDSQTFYLATQYLLATRDKGMHWEAASPDLTATGGDEGNAPAEIAVGRGATGPAISALGVLAQGRESNVGGHEQRLDSTDARWRRALE